jgi:uncharacterized membrane protein YphA (DoxX/SURF4 family)
MNQTQNKSFAILRIIFGFVWLVDASFKWNPAFINNLTDYLAQGAQNQPAIVQAWVNMWIKGVSIDPHFFAIMVAVAETAIAIGLLFGLFTEIAIAGGFAMTLVIWSTAEGFGGPYMAGSTDVGAAIIYALLFVALWLGKSWQRYSVDTVLRKKFSFLYWHW